MNDMGFHRMKALINLMDNDQLIEEIKRMNVGNFEYGQWSVQGITKQEWYDSLVLEAVTRGIQGV